MLCGRITLYDSIVWYLPTYTVLCGRITVPLYSIFLHTLCCVEELCNTTMPLYGILLHTLCCVEELCNMTMPLYGILYIHYAVWKNSIVWYLVTYTMLCGKVIDKLLKICIGIV